MRMRVLTVTLMRTLTWRTKSRSLPEVVVVDEVVDVVGVVVGVVVVVVVGAQATMKHNRYLYKIITFVLFIIRCSLCVRYLDILFSLTVSGVKSMHTLSSDNILPPLE